MITSQLLFECLNVWTTISIALAAPGIGRLMSSFMDSDETGLAGMVGKAETNPGSKSQLTPFFAVNHSDLEVTAQMSSVAVLHCRIEDLGERYVSWIREQGLQLLTVGLERHSTDERVSANFSSPNDWQLRIQSVSLEDEGRYFCQIAHDPPLKLSFSLDVVVPQVDIVDEHGALLMEKYYQLGSTIELKCLVRQVPQSAGEVIWRHERKPLNHDTSRGGISVKTESGSEGTVSRLYIADAKRQDSGNYSCSVGSTAASSVAVTIQLNGEKPGALQHGNGADPKWLDAKTLSCLAAMWLLR